METDAQGELLAQTDYAPFGATLTRAAEAPGYTGHYEDPTTGLTYMQARYYDGEVARFLSVDPTAATPGDLGTFNRYAYARNNPMGYTDPDGRSADPGEAKTLEEVNVFAGFYGGGGMLSGGGLARSRHSYNYERYVPPADPGKAVTLATMQVTGYVSDAADLPSVAVNPTNVNPLDLYPICSSQLPDSSTIGQHVRAVARKANQWGSIFGPIAVITITYNGTNFRKIYGSPDANYKFLGEAGNFAYGAVSADVGVPLEATEMAAGSYARLTHAKSERVGRYGMTNSETINIPNGYAAKCLNP